MKAKKTLLFSDYTLPPADEAHRQATIHAAISLARHPQRSLRLGPQLWVQLAYISPGFWGGTLLVLAAALALVFWLPTRGGASPYETALMLGAVGPALVALAAPELAKSHTHSMWELESACVHSLSRLVSIRMLITGFAALPVLAGILLAVWPAGSWPLALLALLAPFLLSCAACYLVLGLLRGTAGSLTSIGCCALVALGGWLAIARLPGEALASPAFAGLCLAACAAACALCARFAVRKTNDKGDMQHGTSA